jgi:hypothetical protein
VLVSAEKMSIIRLQAKQLWSTTWHVLHAGVGNGLGTQTGMGHGIQVNSSHCWQQGSSE